MTLKSLSSDGGLDHAVSLDGGFHPDKTQRVEASSYSLAYRQYSRLSLAI